MFTNLQLRHNIVRVVIISLMAVPTAFVFLPFFFPTLLAVFFAFGLEPIWDRIGSARRQKKLFPLYLLVFCFFFLIVPFAFVIVKVVRLLQGFSSEGTRNSQLFQSLSAVWDKFFSTTTYVLENLHLGQDVLPTQEEIVSKVSPFVVAGTTSFLGSIPEYALSLAVFLGMLIVLVSHSKRIKSFFMSVEILPEPELNGIIGSLEKNCYMILISTFLIGMLQALIVAVGASIFGYHEFFLIFIITFLLSFIPVIGAAPVSFVLGLASLLMGNGGNAIGLFVVTAIAGSIDNIIKPLVFSNKDESIHPFIMLLGIIGAIVVFGLPGLLLGPLLLQTGFELLPKMITTALKKSVHS